MNDLVKNKKWKKSLLLKKNSTVSYPFPFPQKMDRHCGIDDANDDLRAMEELLLDNYERWMSALGDSYHPGHPSCFVSYLRKKKKKTHTKFLHVWTMFSGVGKRNWLQEKTKLEKSLWICIYLSFFFKNTTNWER